MNGLDKREDSELKINMALDWFALKSSERLGTNAWGVVSVETVWENGWLKDLRLKEETTKR